MFMTSNQCIPVKTMLACSAILSCAYELILLFSVVLYLVRVVHKFDLKLGIH